MSETTFSLLNRLPEIRDSLANSPNEALHLIRDIVSAHALQGFEFELLGRLLSEADLSNVTEFKLCKIALLSNYTTEPLANIFRLGCLKEGYFARIYEAPFNSCKPEILSESSGLYAFNPDVIIIANTVQEFTSLPSAPTDNENIDLAINHELKTWGGLWGLLNERLGIPIIQHLCDIPEQEFLGIAERRAEWSSMRCVQKLNDRLVETSPSYVSWIDIERLASRVGRENWNDPGLYHHGKIGFSSRFLPDYLSMFTAAFRTVVGKAKKALILDLDNTLWGGVIGDDGLNGISLGSDSAEGEAFQAFCSYIKSLGQRGVILGICSKNEFSIASEVFENHPYMPLNLDDFAVIRCNWNDKASNIKNIADELNIDISSLVFVDDNPAECELIRQQLPDVVVMHLEGDPALFSRKLDRQHLFDMSNFTEADLNRTGSYRARAKSTKILNMSSNLDEYLISLDMTSQVKVVCPEELARLTQMEMKTNQFNLSTRRLNEEQLDGMIKSDDTIVLSVYLSDCFTDHGLVSYIALNLVDAKLVITDWLMSCRVFSRTLEHFTLNYIVDFAKDKKINSIEAHYKPTNKNKIMINIFKDMEFVCDGESKEVIYRKELLQDQKPLQCFIK